MTSKFYRSQILFELCLHTGQYDTAHSQAFFVSENIDFVKSYAKRFNALVKRAKENFESQDIDTILERENLPFWFDFVYYDDPYATIQILEFRTTCEPKHDYPEGESLEDLKEDIRKFNLDVVLG